MMRFIIVLGLVMTLPLSAYSQTDEQSDAKEMLMFHRATHEWSEEFVDGKAVETTIYQITKDSDQGIGTVRRKYENEYVTITGTVGAKGIDADGYPYIIMGTEIPVSFHFWKSADEEIKDVEKGDIATFTGYCRYIYPEIIQIYGARLDELKKKNPKPQKDETPVDETGMLDPRTWATGGFGYVANVPDQPLGLGYMKIGRELGAVGMFFDFKIGSYPYDDSGDYYDNISINKAENIFEDPRVGDGSRADSYNGGLTVALAPKYAIYLGGGLTTQTKYRSYRDPTEILGTKGTYWIKESDEKKFNFLGGLLLSNDRFYFQIGYESVPSGVTLGLGYLFM